MISTCLGVNKRRYMETYERKHTALCGLADRRAKSLEVGSVGRHGWRVGAVQVSDAEDIGGAALSGAVQTAAWDVGLTLGQGRGDGEAQEESGGGECELHLDDGL